MDYQHTQFGYTAVLVLIGMVVAVAIAGAMVPGEEWGSLTVGIMGGAFVVIAIVVIWFSRLTVIVGSGEVRAHFGMGMPKRLIPVHNIVGIKQVRNKWYYGWGVRNTGNAWMFNVWGLDAVELDLTNGKRFRIGTDEPAELLAALSAHTALRPG